MAVLACWCSGKLRTVATFKLKAPPPAKSPVLNSDGVRCKALILKTNTTCFTVHTELRASRHVTCLRLPQWRFFGKDGILHLPFRQTRRHIAALTLMQMRRLFYLKESSDTKHVNFVLLLCAQQIYYCYLYQKGTLLYKAGRS